MNLLVFLSDCCNMACDYCFLSLNNKPATILLDGVGLRAVDAHLERCGEDARVTLLGGEPLLHPRSALRLARRAREGGAKTTLVSNGARLTPRIAEELLALGVEIAVSLDGGAASHDAHRRMLDGKGSHAGVIRMLGLLDRSALRVNLVISQDTVGSFLSNVEALRNAGLARLSFHADVANPWSAESLRKLEAALAGFARYARKLGPALSLWHLDSYRRASPAPPTEAEELVLGADGRYYASDAWLSLPYGTNLEGCVGDVERGVDEARRRALLAEADRGVAAALGGLPCYTWPRETWTLAKLAGRDAAAAVRAFRSADAVLGDALSALAREREAAA